MKKEYKIWHASDDKRTMVDFLKRHKIETNYRRKKVKFTIEDGEIYRFDEGKLCSMIIT